MSRFRLLASLAGLLPFVGGNQPALMEGMPMDGEQKAMRRRERIARKDDAEAKAEAKRARRRQRNLNIARRND